MQHLLVQRGGNPGPLVKASSSDPPGLPYKGRGSCPPPLEGKLERVNNFCRNALVPFSAWSKIGLKIDPYFITVERFLTLPGEILNTR
jgi:hypothetical protein